jgi:hypothetical protein
MSGKLLSTSAKALLSIVTLMSLTVKLTMVVVMIFVFVLVMMFNKLNWQKKFQT